MKPTPKASGSGSMATAPSKRAATPRTTLVLLSVSFPVTSAMIPTTSNPISIPSIMKRIPQVLKSPQSLEATTAFLAPQGHESPQSAKASLAA